MARKPADTVALQVRLPEALRRKLAAAADRNKRSLNSEIVWRLEMSAERDRLQEPQNLREMVEKLVREMPRKANDA